MLSLRSPFPLSGCFILAASFLHLYNLWSLGLFHKSNFHLEFSPGSCYSQTKSTRGAESLSTRARPDHAIAEVLHQTAVTAEPQTQINRATWRQQRLKTKSKTNKTPRSANVWSSSSNTGYLFALKLCCSMPNLNNQTVVRKTVCQKKCWWIIDQLQCFCWFSFTDQFTSKQTKETGIIRPTAWGLEIRSLLVDEQNHWFWTD